MTKTLDTEPENKANVERTPATQDRRRPGRVTHMSPALIKLLRWRPGIDDWNAGNPLGAARGIMLGTAFGLVAWTGLIWSIADLLR